MWTRLSLPFRFRSDRVIRDHAIRTHCIRQLRDALQAHIEELREITIEEAGAPAFLSAGLSWKDQWRVSVGRGPSRNIQLGNRSRRSAADGHQDAPQDSPGLVGAITPRDFPHQIDFAKLGPRLDGNTVVLKPAPDTPWGAALVGKFFGEESDVPAGVVNIVTSDDHRLGAQLAEDPRIDLISFTDRREPAKPSWVRPRPH